jgi:hypothetical protein
VLHLLQLVAQLLLLILQHTRALLFGEQRRPRLLCCCPELSGLGRGGRSCASVCLGGQAIKEAHLYHFGPTNAYGGPKRQQLAVGAD